jgi:hypothetical protein
MKQNVGVIDRYIRIFAGIALVLVGTIGINNLLLTIIGLIVMGTGVFRFCALYSVLDINTSCRAEKKDEGKKEGGVKPSLLIAKPVFYLVK